MTGETNPDSSDRTGGVGSPRPTSSSSPLPDRDHLRRLRTVFSPNPLYFLTCCTAERRPILTHERSAAVLIDTFRASPKFHGWTIGRYVIMPDHVHFFARSRSDAKPLTAFMGDWKKWTASKIAGALGLLTE